MTWAQGTFGFCFGILVPLVGVLCAVRLKREGKSRLMGFVVGAGATFVGFIGCCFLAMYCYPEYHTRQSPPELLASAFALPGVVFGIAVVWFISRAREESRRFCTFASVVVFAMYLAGLGICYEMFVPAYRRNLPWSAQEIHEFYWSETILPDYLYELKARMTEEQFHDYVARFRLTPHTTTRQYSDDLTFLSWRPSKEHGWWDPSDSLDGTFVWQSGHTWTFAKYENGYLYLSSGCH